MPDALEIVLAGIVAVAMPLPLSVPVNSARVTFAASNTVKWTVPVGAVVAIPDDFVTCAVKTMEPVAPTLMEAGEAVTVVVVVERQPDVGSVVPLFVTLSVEVTTPPLVLTAVKRYE